MTDGWLRSSVAHLDAVFLWVRVPQEAFDTNTWMCMQRATGEYIVTPQYIGNKAADVGPFGTLEEAQACAVSLQGVTSD